MYVCWLKYVHRIWITDKSGAVFPLTHTAARAPGCSAHTTLRFHNYWQLNFVTADHHDTAVPALKLPSVYSKRNARAVFDTVKIKIFIFDLPSLYACVLVCVWHTIHVCTRTCLCVCVCVCVCAARRHVCLCFIRGGQNPTGLLIRRFGGSPADSIGTSSVTAASGVGNNKA